MRVVVDFSQSCTFVKNVNATFVSLIPKKVGAEDMRDFRPISLLGSVYKIISKVLAKRLKPLLSKIISRTQNAVVDAVLIANEAIDSRLRNGEEGVMCKLDIEKAFDHVNWNFLMFLLKRMGFGEKWLKWIWRCISTVSLALLVNGKSAGFFPTSRGIRQGDPLSPMLFIIIMEALSRMIEKSMKNGLADGFKVDGTAGNSVMIYHLLYVDDSLIFCSPDKEQLGLLRSILIWFEIVSGLRVNLKKSEMFSVGSGVDLSSLAEGWGCKVGYLPTSYLGLPLGASFKLTSVWEPVIERFEKKLSGWKRGYISKGGKMTLIKSTLQNLPVYFMSLFRIPSSVAKRLEKIQRNFLWDGIGDEKKIHLVKWEMVCRLKRAGGWVLKPYL